MGKLDKIKESKLAHKSKGFFGEFKEFVLRGNVMDMAIGVIIGTAFAGIVSALTDDFINPLINCIGGAEVSGKLEIFSTGQYLNWGHFITAIINFLIMAAVLFIMLKAVNKLLTVGKKEEEKKEEEPKKSNEEVLLEEIRDLLKKQSK